MFLRSSIMFLRHLRSVIPQSRRLFSSSVGDEFQIAIEELNQEMESVFGSRPPAAFSSASDNKFVVQETHNKTRRVDHSVDCNLKTGEGESLNMSQHLQDNASTLSHIDSRGEAQMVDVSSKGDTKRTATASCKVMLGKRVFDLVAANQLGKGDVMSVAKIAGIGGAKHTSNLIPLCHNITLTNVRVDLRLNPEDYSIGIEGEAASTGKTGVEMEALMAVSIAGLTVYDMCKAASKDISITEIRLERKNGGKSGYWSRED